MTMRVNLLLTVLLIFSISVCSAIPTRSTSAFLDQQLKSNPDYEALAENMKGMTMDDFLNLTPKQYKEMTGKKLGVKKSIQLKAAQKFIKKQQKKGDDDIPKGLYIVGAIIGFSWLLMGIMDDFEGNNWWITLLLYVVCWIPGVIYAFIKMDEYY